MGQQSRHSFPRDEYNRRQQKNRLANLPEDLHRIQLSRITETSQHDGENNDRQILDDRDTDHQTPCLGVQLSPVDEISSALPPTRGCIRRADDHRTCRESSCDVRTMERSRSADAEFAGFANRERQPPDGAGSILEESDPLAFRTDPEWGDFPR